MRQVTRVLVAFLTLMLVCGALAQSGSERATGQVNDALSSFFGAGGSSTVTPAQVAAVDPGQFDYTYDPALVPQVQAQVLAILAGTPESQAAAQDILDQLTLEQQQAVIADGFPDGTWSATNLIDVVSATVLTAYGILQNLESTTPEQDAAVRDLFRVAFATTDLANLSDADKQLAAEPLLLATIITAVQYSYAREGAQAFSLADLQESARQVLQTFGLDPQFFTLGADGLEPTPQLQRVQNGELTMEQAFPEVMAQLNALGVEPTVLGVDTSGAATPTAPSPAVGTPDATAQAQTYTICYPNRADNACHHNARHPTCYDAGHVSRDNQPTRLEPSGEPAGHGDLRPLRGHLQRRRAHANPRGLQLLHRQHESPRSDLPRSGDRRRQRAVRHLLERGRGVCLYRDVCRYGARVDERRQHVHPRKNRVRGDEVGHAYSAVFRRFAAPAVCLRAGLSAAPHASRYTVLEQGHPRR